MQSKTATGIVMLGLLSTLTGAAQSVKDLFEDRILLRQTGFEIDHENGVGGFEPMEPSEMIKLAEGSLWLEWKAPISDRFTVSTAGSDFDSVLGVYQGGTLGDLDLVVFNDDEDLIGGVFTSRATFFAIAGETYQIVVGALKDSVSSDALLQIHLDLQPSAGEILEPWSVRVLGDDLTFNSDRLSGDLWIVDFWATWCVPCRAEIPIFNELQERFGNRGLRVLGVSVDSVAVSEVLDFADQFPIEFPIAMTDSELEEIFGGIASIPTAVVLDAGNRLITRHVGFRDRAFWMEEIESLLAPVGMMQSPVLNIRLLPENGQIEISWSARSDDWRLETASDLASAWSRVDVQTERSDSLNKVQLPIESGQNHFFRLKQP